MLFVTHDRSFVEHVATRIVDIDRGKLRSWPGGYRDFLEQKAKAEQEEDLHNSLFDKKLAAEEIWIRQGVKARTTRNEGRVRALEGLREERAQRIKRPRTARIKINESEELSGRKVIEARNVSHSFGGQPLLNGFSLRVMRGDRLGIIGNNGVGKSTLLRILLGELQPDSGTVKLGTNLEVAYFDQLRREVDPTKTVAEIIGEGRDYVTIQGVKKHVVAYLTDFLFSREARSDAGRSAVRRRAQPRHPREAVHPSCEPVGARRADQRPRCRNSRVARGRLAEYDGTLLVVSHDRYFLDAVVTSTLVFEAGGQIQKHAGGYSDWLERRQTLAVVDEPTAKRVSAPRAQQQSPPPPRKLSYKLQRELDGLPTEIDRIERRIVDLETQISAPDFYRQPHVEVQERLAELASTQQQLDAAIERWSALEDQAASIAAGAERGTPDRD